MSTYTALSLPTPTSSDAITRAISVLQRHIAMRSAVPCLTQSAPANALQLTLAFDAGLPVDAYRIEGGSDGALTIAGQSPVGLLHGLGHFLRDCRFTETTITPGAWRGASAPECPLRGIYFALHNNWYMLAPMEEIARYVEDLALWGINTIGLHLPQHENSTTPQAQAMRARNRALVAVIKETGLQVALLKEPNIGFANAPAELLAAEFPDTDPPSRGFAGTRICPSTPEGFAHLSRMLDDYIAGYEDLGIDYVVAFPYDSGGCGCADCWPWGARGFLKISQEFARLARVRYPQSQFILGTWCFDVLPKPDGEYAGLDRYLRDDPASGWMQWLMTDAHGDFPRWPLDHGTPGGLPTINFAEISMWGRFPWGGYGANPLPERHQRIWDQSGHLLSGGLPYSEGIFEDLNKVLYARFFWDKTTTARETVRAYIAYEFDPAVVDLVSEAVTLLEANYDRSAWTLPAAQRAWALLQQADALMPPRARECWRWRLLYLRGLIDVELLTHIGEVSDACDAAYDEIIAIYHAEYGWRCTTPWSRAFLARDEARMQGRVAALPPGADQGMVSETAQQAVTAPPGSSS